MFHGKLTFEISLLPFLKLIVIGKKCENSGLLFRNWSMDPMINLSNLKQDWTASQLTRLRYSVDCLTFWPQTRQQKIKWYLSIEAARRAPKPKSNWEKQQKIDSPRSISYSLMMSVMTSCSGIRFADVALVKGFFVELVVVCDVWIVIKVIIV